MSASISPAAARITADDATIAQALEGANVATLVMSLIHLTGDARILEGLPRPSPLQIAQQNEQRIGEPAASMIRARTLKALIAFRDGDDTLPPPPSPGVIQRMVDYYIGESVAPDYIPMIMEELALDGVDSRAYHWRNTTPPARRDEVSVLVIGAGFAGLLAGTRLAEAGISFTIVDKNPEVGGTWYENRYPGCRVDNGNHYYSYSFAPNYDWSEHYCQRDEIFAYLNRFADERGLRDAIRFSTEVIEARCVDRNWEVDLGLADGSTETVVYDAVISCVGQLNRPNIPDFRGRDRFQGIACHTARWDRAMEYRGKRIAIIGIGASGLQLIPELAKHAEKLTVFQRGRQWIAPCPDYHEKVTDAQRWVIKHVPYYARWYRFLVFWSFADGTMPTYIVDPAWPDQVRSISAANEQLRQALVQYMESQLRDRPDLIEKVIPDYPPGGKRPLMDNGSWLRALQQENVEYVVDPIAEITENAIIDASGTRHPVDLIVYATGYHANKFLQPMRIVGREGTVLSEAWGEDPYAYLGIVVPEFPNFFITYGPGTNNGHGGSIIANAEWQIRFIMQSLRLMLEDDYPEMEVRKDVCDAFMWRLRQAQDRMVWSHPRVASWTQNSKGKVITNSPWLLVHSWKWAKEVTPELFVEPTNG